MEQLYFNIREIAKILGNNHQTIARMVEAGTFPKPIKVGKQKQWHKDIIDKWINDNEAKQRGNIVWYTGGPANPKE